MGYTNYWHQYNDFTDEQWKQIKEEYNYIKEVCKNIIDDETHQDDEIVFNGINDNQHETFVLNKNVNTEKRYPEHDTSFNFCKTRMKPYDIAVWYLLTFINRICPEISISRDR
jgi:hypothetical protein